MLKLGKHPSIPDGLDPQIQQLEEHRFVKCVLFGSVSRRAHNRKIGELRFHRYTRRGFCIKFYVEGAVLLVFLHMNKEHRKPVKKYLFPENS